MSITLPNAGSEKYRNPDIKIGSKVHVCVWGQGIFVARVALIAPDMVVVRGKRLSGRGSKRIQEKRLKLSEICYIEPVKNP